MSYPASEKLEVIRLVVQSHLHAKRSLEQLGIARRTFCRWHALKHGRYTREVRELEREMRRLLKVSY
jgi:predicted DNA-binding protein (UPF0251 family)